MSQKSGVDQAELKKLLSTMKKFPARVQRNIVNGTARAATVVVQKEMISRVPYETGTLEDAIKVKKLKNPKPNETAYTSYIKRIVMQNGKLQGGLGKQKLKNTKQYAYYLEYGTSYMRSQPFIRPSLYAVGNRPLEEAKRYFFTNMEKKAVKLGLSQKNYSQVGSRGMMF